MRAMRSTWAESMSVNTGGASPAGPQIDTLTPVGLGYSAAISTGLARPARRTLWALRISAADGRPAAVASTTSSPERAGWANSPAGLRLRGSPAGAVQRTGSRSTRNRSAHCWGLAACVGCCKSSPIRRPTSTGAS